MELEDFLESKKVLFDKVYLTDLCRYFVLAINVSDIFRIKIVD